MKELHKINFLLLFLFSVLEGKSQDINLSQFYEQPLLRNPALAGIFSGDVRVTASYRNQWQSVTTPYRTMALGSELNLPKGANSNVLFTLGLQITNDIAGDSKLGKTQIFPAINFHIPIGQTNGYISAGFMGGPVLHQFDPAKLQFDDQFVNGAFDISNPTRQTFSNTNFTYWDIAGGASYTNTIGEDIYYYVGLGVSHIRKPYIAFLPTKDIRLNPKLVVNAGLSAPFSESDKIILYADYFMQGNNQLAQGGLLFNHDLAQDEDENKISIAGGVFYRWNDAAIPVIKFDYYALGLGFSYDVNISKLKAASQMRGGMEVSLSYKDYLNVISSSRDTKCPKF